ncbi:MAG: GNAT family N-acetyltransferase [Pelomonas sp.]|nr:GNAT family N-acetyltransferase [Roseateles sp.]
MTVDLRLSLAPPTPADIPELLQFETANRAFFEARVNSRPAAYYSPEGVAAAIETAARDAASDQGYQYLVRDAAGALVARVNLVRVRRAHFHSAELGYRVAEAACGRGVASAAVRELLALAFGPLRLQRVEANARAENLASCRVLECNGFVAFGRSRRSFELGGVWYDRVYYERHVTAA